MEFECPICLENTENNVKFICGHMICSICFDSCINYEVNPNFKCPMCRRIVFVKNDSIIFNHNLLYKKYCILILISIILFILVYLFRILQ